MKPFFIIIFLFFFITVSNAQWKQTNGPHGVSSIMSLGSNGEYIYAGTNGVANVFISQNNGDSWENKSKGLEGILLVECFEFIDNNIFIGTSGGGVFMSSDNGENWVTKNSGLSNLFIRSMFRVGNTLFIASNDNYVSTDFGDSWEPIETGLNRFSTAQDWTYKDNILFAAEVGWTGEGHPGLGVIKSTDKWKNWQIANNGLTNIKVYSIVSNDEFVYAGTLGGVFISSDNGDNWNAFNNGLTDLNIMCLALKDEYIFAGTYKGVFYSTNNGLEWTSAGDLLKNKRIADILIRNNEIYVATNSGIFLSTDNGANWESKNSNIISTHTLDIALAGDKIIAATYANGTFQTTDRGEDWSEVEMVSEESILGMESKSNLIIAKGYGNNNKIFLSEDYGITWNNITSDIDASVVLGVYIIDDNLIAGTEMGTFKSTNLGENWVKIDTIYGIQKIVRHDDKLFAAPPYEGLLVSTDNGINWSKYTEFLNNRLVTAYAFDENFVYVAALERGLYISSDNGENWELSDFDISNNTVYSIKVVGGSIFMSVYGRGVFQSTDNGANWNEINTGFTNLYISQLLVYGDEIFASTGGSGVYKAKLIDFGVVNSVENQTEDMNYLYSYPAYPMPASNEVRTLVYWDLSFDTENYNIAVYDLLGNKVSDASSIRIEPHTPYSGNVIWNCSGVEPGIYLMRIKHGTEAKTIKVMVQR
jgi:photosystem II stability/assembly factor-like uncharacterized protein